MASGAFVTFTLSSISLVGYAVWACIPPAAAGNGPLATLPSREWAVLLPAWLTVAVWLAYLAYFATNLRAVPAVEGRAGLYAITDTAASHRRAGSIKARPGVSHGIPTLRDIPPGSVNRWYFRATATERPAAYAPTL